MASKIKFENAQKLLNAASNTINDLLKENFELKEQINKILTGKNENKAYRRTMDFSK